MTADIDAFHAAIYANPADPLVRLAYADFLDDRGEPEYAELIRLWHAIDRYAAPRHHTTLRADRHKLVQALDRRWADSELRLLGVFDRGVLPDSLTVTGAQLLRWSRWPAFLRPRELVVYDYAGAEAEVLTAPPVTRATELCFQEIGAPLARPPYPPDSDRLLDELSRPDRLPELQVLLLRDARPSRRGLCAFGESSLAARLSGFAFRFALGREPHDAHSFEVDQPPAGAVREAILEFVTEYGPMLPP